MGSATAWALSRTGVRVVLLEALTLGHSRGSSHGTSRIVRKSYPSALYSRLAGRAYDSWKRLENACGSRALLRCRDRGGLDVGTEASLQPVRDAAKFTGLQLDELPAPVAAERFGLCLGPGETCLHQADTCVVSADAAVAAMQAAALAAGAVLVEGAVVIALEPINGNGYSLRCADGRSFRAVKVALCPGPWTASLLTRLQLPGLSPLPLRVLQVTTAFFTQAAGSGPPPAVMIDYGSSACSGAPCYAVPDVDDDTRVKVAMHCGVLSDADARSGEPDCASLAAMRKWVRERLPAFDSEKPIDASTCLYTMTPDEGFVIDAVSGSPGVVLATGGSGHAFKFAPLIGEMVASLLMTGSLADALGDDAAPAAAAFALDRPALRAPLSATRNSFGQPVGAAIVWAPLPPLRRASMRPLAGRYCRLEVLDPVVHGSTLAVAWEQSPAMAWTYLPVERPSTPASRAALMEGFAASDDPMHFAVLDTAHGGAAVGSLALMRVDTVHGVCEIGHVNFTSPLVARSRMATEAVALLLGFAFEAGFRRIEWKCDALNAPSVRAALRYGFKAEGVFREHFVIKGRLRDTAWFALLRSEWEPVRAALQCWLAPKNFDEDGVQLRALGAFMQGTVETSSASQP